VHRHALARVLRTPTQRRARYAPTQEHRDVWSCGRVGLTAARFKPNALRCRNGGPFKAKRAAKEKRAAGQTYEAVTKWLIGVRAYAGKSASRKNPGLVDSAAWPPSS
jgi:hypothetical protein